MNVECHWKRAVLVWLYQLNIPFKNFRYWILKFCIKKKFPRKTHICSNHANVLKEILENSYEKKKHIIIYCFFLNIKFIIIIKTNHPHLMFYLRKRFSVTNNGQNEKRFWLHRRKLPKFMVRTQFYPATGYGVL